MMVRIRAAAEAELEDAWLYYRNVRPALADNFLTKYEEAIRRIAESPFRFAKLLDSPEIRRIRLDPFPYALVYQVRSDAAVIIAVIHDSRDPNYWIGRVEQ